MNASNDNWSIQMSNRYFAIDTSRPYLIEVTCFQNIEDVDGDFVTQEELRETYGLNPCAGTFLQKNEVEKVIAELVTTAREKGKKTFTIDESVVDVSQAGQPKGTSDSGQDC
jgi:hypothetical protein